MAKIGFRLGLYKNFIKFIEHSDRLPFKYFWKVYKAAWEVSRGPILSTEWKDLDQVKKDCTTERTVDSYWLN